MATPWDHDFDIFWNDKIGVYACHKKKNTKTTSYIFQHAIKLLDG